MPLSMSHPEAPRNVSTCITPDVPLIHIQAAAEIAPPIATAARGPSLPRLADAANNATNGIGQSLSAAPAQRAPAPE
jgi:hypothetical protein